MKRENFVKKRTKGWVGNGKGGSDGEYLSSSEESVGSTSEEHG